MKILIRLPNWLGDVVMSTAFIAAVEELYPAATIDVIIKAELSSIAALIPNLHKVHVFSKGQYNGLRGVYRFGKSLRTEKYDLFFNLPTSLSSILLAWATGANKRVGFGSEGGFFMLTHRYKKPLNIHRVEEYITLLERFTGKTIRHKKVRLNTSGSSNVDKNRILINFNSEAESRRMPLNKGRAIINLLTNTFTTKTFALVGSPKESAFVDQLIEGLENQNRIENLSGKTDLAGLADLMATSAALLTTDSGPAHLANSLNIPTVVLFGAGNEHNTGPYNKTNLSVLRYGGLKCEPCVRNTCRLYELPKCIALLDDLQIIDALKRYLI